MIVGVRFGANVTFRMVLFVLPARSIATISIEFDPAVSGRSHVNVEPDSCSVVPPQLAVSRPEPFSITLPLITTGETWTVAPTDGEATTTTGAVLSTLIRAVADAWFPATSVALPTIRWSACSVEMS